MAEEAQRRRWVRSLSPTRLRRFRSLLAAARRHLNVSIQQTWWQEPRHVCPSHLLGGLVRPQGQAGAGEKGVVLLLAPDMRQAKVSLDYAEGVLQSTPIMRQLLAARTADTLTLSNGISLEVRSASFRRIRGVSALPCWPMNAPSG
jgi:hypothetical protein